MQRLRSLLSKAPPLAQLAHVVWSASKQVKLGFVPQVVPKFKRFEYDLRTSSLARFAPAVSSLAGGGKHEWVR